MVCHRLHCLLFLAPTVSFIELAEVYVILNTIEDQALKCDCSTLCKFKTLEVFL